MHPKIHAVTQPDKPAVIMADGGQTISYAQLDAESNRRAHLFRNEGLQIGDTIAICMENHLGYFPLTWAAQRAGLHYVCISNRLTAGEVGYIIQDSGAKMLFGSAAMTELFDTLAKDLPDVKQLMHGGTDARDLDAALDGLPTTPIADERAGTDMLYSSGTTGRPKGVRIPLPEDPAINGMNALVGLASQAFGLSGESLYLSPAPLYHAAPLRWCMTVHKLGGTVVVMEKFDPERALQLIESHGCTDGQFVPTHFVRMLKLPEDVRARYNVSTMKCAIHAAAPCPVPVKKAMIEWWGPVIKEYYAGTEGNGFTFISAPEWMERPGSVGRALLGTIKICDEAGAEVPARQEGLIYFAGGSPFSYHNDPEKTRESRHPLHEDWTALGDIGWVDEEGYLFLTDRKSFMIISGGVNIYPQEIENLLVTHPKVADAAVIGAPDAEMGEKVVAVVQPLNPADAGDALADELKTYLRAQLSGVKMPRQIDFREELPRHATGKLYKRLLRDEYWAGHTAKIG